VLCSSQPVFYGVIFQIEALTVESDVSEEQQQVLDGLEARISAVIELYEKDGALIKINGRWE
jgi:hypothetical protein